MKYQSTIHYEFLERSKNRITVMQGGSRSGKTFNLLYWLVLSTMNKNIGIISIVRKTLTALRASAYRDFLNIVDNLGIYNVEDHNKTEMTYNIGDNTFEFFSLDQAQKIRGRKRHYLFINEANEISFEDWQQLIMRTEGKIILDFNPSDEFHFIYDKIITRDDSDFLKTTYKDNPYLSDALVKEIEYLKDVDENYWRVYGLGERGASKATIFTNWEIISDEKYNKLNKPVSYGLDFGYNDPSSLIEIKKYDGGLYWNQKLYESYLTSDDLVTKIKKLIQKNNAEIIADSARPEIIEQMYRSGLNIKASKKGKNSVKDGIDYIKQNRLYITESSTELIKEVQMYKWKVDKNEHVLEEPVDINNHAIDAGRYGSHTEEKKLMLDIV